LVDYWDVRRVAAKAVSSVVPMVCQWVDGSAVSWVEQRVVLLVDSMDAAAETLVVPRAELLVDQLAYLKAES